MLRKKLGGVGWGEQNADCLKQTHGLERCQWKLSHNPLVESQCWDCFCCFKGALRLKTFHVYQDNSWAPILFFSVHRCLRAKGLIFFSCVKFAIFWKLVITDVDVRNAEACHAQQWGPAGSRIWRCPPKECLNVLTTLPAENVTVPLGVFFVFESFDLVALAQIAQFVRGDRVWY